MPGPDCRKSPDPLVFADDQFYLQRMRDILQQKQHPTTAAVDGSTADGGTTHLQLQAQFGLQLHPVQLLEHVFIGNQRIADSVDVMRLHGITHVLNCAGLRRYDFTRSPYPKDSGIKGFLMISAEDNEEYDIKRHFPDAIAFLDDVKRLRGRSLVHCNLGVNRSGAVVAAYLMASERRTLLDVMQYLRSRRSLILSNKGFRRQLVSFARERGLLDPVIQQNDTDDSATEVVVNNNSLMTRSHNGDPTSSQSTCSTPSVVVSGATDHHGTSDTNGGGAAAEDGGHRYWSSRPANWQLSPVYEQQGENSSSPGGVLGGFLTLFGAGAGRRRPLRSTSFSNVSSCTAGNASTSTTAATATASGTPAEEPKATLSTARPLRVYTRSSTDTELYRRRPAGARPPPSHVVVRQQFSKEHGRPAD